ncbi:hypothetical protein Pfo_001488, partial [Paulownia fortunei]
CVDLLLSENSTTKGTLEVNAKNGKGLTTLDVLDIQDSYDIKIRQKLECAGSIIAPDSASITAEKSPQQAKNLKKNFKPNHDLQLEPSKNWFKYFKFQMQRDSPGDTRNALLVVAALIATVCFQAGINPPNGILDKAPQSNTPNQGFSGTILCRSCRRLCSCCSSSYFRLSCNIFSVLVCQLFRPHRINMHNNISHCRFPISKRTPHSIVFYDVYIWFCNQHYHQ